MTALIPQIERLLFTAKARTLGGPDGGSSRTDDGRLDLEFSPPGSPGNGTNPAQLLAVGWSNCLLSTMKQVAAKSKIAMPQDAAIDAEVDAGIAGGGVVFQARFDFQLPDVSPEIAEKLIAGAEGACPYSKATRGNVNVAFTCNGAQVASLAT